MELVGGCPARTAREPAHRAGPLHGRAQGALPRHLHQRRGPGPGRLEQGHLRRHQPPLLRARVPADHAPQGQLPVAGDVAAARVLRRRPEECRGRRRLRRGDRHQPPRADDACARRVGALRQGSVGLRQQQPGAAGVLARRHGAAAGPRGGGHPGHARRRRRADERGDRHRPAGEDRGRPAPDHRRGHRQAGRADPAGVGAVQGSAGLLRQGHARPGRRDPAVRGRQLGQHPPPARPGRQAPGRLWRVLPLRLRRRPAQLQVDQHHPDRARLGADAPGLGARRGAAVGGQRRRHQAAGNADQRLPRPGLGPGCGRP